MAFAIERLAAALRQCYGVEMERAERISYGIWEEPFRVWTSEGLLFAKRFRRRRELAEMQRGLALSQELLAAGFPAPRLLAPLQGQALPDAQWIAGFGDERYILTEWVEGRSYYPGELPLACARPMGALLGRLHRMLGPGGEDTWRYRSVTRALEEVRALLARYQGEPAPFAAVAREVLTEQAELLAALPTDFHEQLPVPHFVGGRFGAFWIEQLLFQPDGEVAALVDWTDGAGHRGYWVGDLSLGIHLGALDRAATTEYVAGYQRENPLPRSEWEALAAEVTYGHLASVNFLGGWLDSPLRRSIGRDETSELWHRNVPLRFRERELWLEAILKGAE